MHLFLVFFLLCLGHALAALLALVVLSRAAYVVHSELGGLHIFLTEGASLGFNRPFSLLHCISINIVNLNL